MRPYAIRFPITDGIVVGWLEAALASYSSGLTVQRTMPATSTRRMVTVRNDSGPEEGFQSRRRYGINVWADSAVDPENMCLDAMKYIRTAPNGLPVTAVDELSGPYQIDDETPLVVGKKSLAHFYFTFRLSVRGA